MCGRYSNHVDAMRTWVSILGDWPRDVKLSYNVAPSQTIPLFTSQKGVAMRWGLVPRWSKESTLKYATFNARLESVDSKPTYRSAWRKSQRCLIPAQGFFEWRKEENQKQPFFIRARSENPLVFAGVWDIWKGKDLDLLSCSIITKPADDLMKPLHSRMPVILEQKHAQDWLHVSPEDAKQLIGFQKIDLDYYKVGRAVNNSRNDGPELIEKLENVE